MFIENLTCSSHNGKEALLIKKKEQSKYLLMEDSNYTSAIRAIEILRSQINVEPLTP